jgi:hypothetical protein
MFLNIFALLMSPICLPELSYPSLLVAHLPDLATHLPGLATNLPHLATFLSDLATHLPRKG